MTKSGYVQHSHYYVLQAGLLSSMRMKHIRGQKCRTSLKKLETRQDANAVLATRTIRVGENDCNSG